MATSNSAQFDGLRGLACLLVLVPHMRYFGYYLAEFVAFGRFAQFGLFLFFFLSAYLISKSVLIDSRDGLVQVWPAYAIKRIFRIVPLYGAVLFLDYALFHFYFGATGSRDLAALLAHLTFAEGRSALWTMPVEMRFYVLLIPVMLAMALAMRLPPVARKAAIASMLGTGLLWHACTYFFAVSGSIATLGVHKYAPYFVFGALVAGVRVVFAHDMDRIPSRLWDFAGLCALSLFILQNPYWWQALFPFEGWRYDPANVGALSFDVYLVWRMHAMVLIVAVIFLAADRTSSWMQRILAMRMLVWVGRHSYGIYLLHMPAIYIVQENVTKHPQWGMLVVLGLTCTMAWALHRCVELPGIRLGNRIIGLQKRFVGRMRGTGNLSLMAFPRQ